MVARGEFIQQLGRLAYEGRDVLSSVGWLSRVPEGFRDAMLDIAIWRLAETGTEFIHNGVDKGGMFAVVRGSAETSLYLGHPDTRMIHVAGPGFWAGNRSLLGRTRQVALVAREEVLWGFFPQVRVEQLLAEEPSWWRHVCELFDDAMLICMGIMSDLSLQDSRKRAVAILLRAAGCRYDDPALGMKAFIGLSQADLAAMGVMSRNTFNGIVSDLKSQGLIEHSYRNFAIPDPAALRALIEG
ncbi:Crp/Fnr family transcriptional regulator [Sphingomonas daechungensis]|uniref:Crp/Fnr family transcriptional regulator n=1 Tax=Sphingomonas daechungensis TaxID=1176646 RepID=UPI0037850EB4